MHKYCISCICQAHTAALRSTEKVTSRLTTWRYEVRKNASEHIVGAGVLHPASQSTHTRARGNKLSFHPLFFSKARLQKTLSNTNLPLGQSFPKSPQQLTNLSSSFISSTWAQYCSCAPSLSLQQGRVWPWAGSAALTLISPEKHSTAARKTPNRNTSHVLQQDI